VVFLAFVVHPVGYALWLASDLSLYAALAKDPLYPSTLVNTLLFVGLGVNVQLFLALLLSGFFVRQRWWTNVLLLIFILPWLLAAIQAFISIHWMLIGEQGLVDRALSTAFGIDGPMWFSHRWLALGANIVSYTWKWMPFWTVVFLAGRLAIHQDIYDAAAVDGATGTYHFAHIVWPLLADLYLISTLLFTLWTLGDFVTVHFVSGGAPAWSTEVLATRGFEYAYDDGRPEMGVAAVLPVLPVLIPLAIVIMRKLRTSEAKL
jgi:multiple sugar transport system permease protein